MIIHGLSLENFRLHASTDIEFAASGTTGIVGSNEGGKSTVIEGLAFALFGTAATRGKKASLRWSRAPSRHPASVELSFEVGGKRYHLERSESDARLFEEGQDMPIAAGTSAVDGYVPTLLGMTLDEFRATHLMSQKEIDRLGTMGPTERRQFFLKVLGVEMIDVALKDCRERKNELAHTVAGVRQGIGEADGLQAEVEAAGAALSTAEVERDAAAESLKEAGTASDKAAAGLAEIEGVKKTLDDLEARLARERRDLDQATNEVGRLTAELTDVPAPVSPGEMEARRDRRALTQDRLLGLRSARADLRADAAAKARAAEADAKREADTARRIREMGRDAPCPSCTRPIGESFDRLVSDALERRIVAEEAAREHAGAESAHSQKTDQEIALEVEIDGVTSELEALAARHAKAEAAQGTRTALEHWSAKAETAEAAAAATSDAILAVHFDAGVYDERRHAASAAREALQAVERTFAACEPAVRSARERLDRAKSQLADHSRRVAEAEAYESDLRTHERAAERLHEFRTEMAAGIQPDLEALASGFVQILTDGRHEGLLIGDNFEARLLEDGIETEVVSGGTEDLTAIAMRLAVSQMIAERAGQPLSLLILDEPFGSLDAVRRGNVLTLIERLRGVFQQVILISHVEETREACDHVIEVAYSEAQGRAIVTQDVEAVA